MDQLAQKIGEINTNYDRTPSPLENLSRISNSVFGPDASSRSLNRSNNMNPSQLYNSRRQENLKYSNTQSISQANSVFNSVPIENSNLVKKPDFTIMIENEVLNKKVDELEKKIEEGWMCANYWRRKCLELKTNPTLEKNDNLNEQIFSKRSAFSQHSGTGYVQNKPQKSNSMH